jgi:hypothetical protein
MFDPAELTLEEILQELSSNPTSTWERRLRAELAIRAENRRRNLKCACAEDTTECELHSEG